MSHTKNLFFIAALSAAPLAAAAQDVTLTPSLKDGKARLEGSASLPDGTVLRITLQRLDEQVAGGRLQPSDSFSGSLLATISSKAYSVPLAVQSAGLYRATVDIPEEEQIEAVAMKLGRLADPPKREYTLRLWGGGFVSSLPRHLSGLDALAQESAEFVQRVERATSSEEAWKKESEGLLKEAESLQKKIDAADCRTRFSAAHRELAAVSSGLLALMRMFKWNVDGSFEGPWDYHTGAAAKTHRQEDFSFDALRRYAEEAKATAGREFGLWLVKELQRVEGLKDRAAAAKAARAALKTCAEHEGFEDSAKALDGLFAGLADGQARERKAEREAEIAQIESRLRGEEK